MLAHGDLAKRRLIKRLTTKYFIVKINDLMGRPLTSSPTRVHKRILEALACVMEGRGHCSVSDLVRELNLAGDSSVTATLKIMQRNGYIHIHGGGTRGRRRTLSLTTQGRESLGLGGLRILGSIPAGPLSDILDQCDSIVDIVELFPYKPGDFLLTVQGDSMIGDGILPNDKVLLRPNVAVKHQEIAAVHVGDEYLATLKRVCFSRDGRRVTLKASNSRYTNVVVPAESVKVVGVFRGLIRLS